MTTALIIIFVLAYFAIALEQPLKIDKSASALIGAGVLWTVYAAGLGDIQQATAQLTDSLVTTAQIIFFLLGAMAIVETVDAHDGFAILTERVRARSLSGLLWLVSLATFFLSALLDNLTTAIVMVSLTRKLIAEREDRLLFAGMVIIAANAGGAWTPLGDVTTTMLWIGGQISALNIMATLFGPSLVNLLVPLAILSWHWRGRPAGDVPAGEASAVPRFESRLMFWLGLVILLLVPVFKAVTGLPPFMAMLTGLGIVWLVGDLVHRDAAPQVKEQLSLAGSLSRIDMGAITFFAGILLAVAALEHAHILRSLAGWLDQVVGRQELIVMIIGVASAVVDNVPLVAAAMGMYPLDQFPRDHFLWEFIAYCAGTGGSMLVIGSAAGVAAMGIEKIDFLWYLRRVSFLALLGYFAGALLYIFQFRVLN